MRYAGGQRPARRDAAALLIATLWQARGGWPQGWPPDAVREVVGPTYGDETPRLPPWLSSLDDLEALHRAERAAWVDAALLEVGADTLRQALDAAPDDPSQSTDLRDIQWQLRHYDEAEGRIAGLAHDDEEPSRRADRVRIHGRVLEDIAERRATLIERALKDARRGQRRKPSRNSGVTGSP
jgi:hypothetical protein